MGHSVSEGILVYVKVKQTFSQVVLSLYHCLTGFAPLILHCSTRRPIASVFREISFISLITHVGTFDSRRSANWTYTLSSWTSV